MLIHVIVLNVITCLIINKHIVCSLFFNYICINIMGNFKLNCFVLSLWNVGLKVFLLKNKQMQWTFSLNNHASYSTPYYFQYFYFLVKYFVTILLIFSSSILFFVHCLYERTLCWYFNSTPSDCCQPNKLNIFVWCH